MIVPTPPINKKAHPSGWAFSVESEVAEIETASGNDGGGERGIRAALLRARERQSARRRFGWRGSPIPPTSPNNTPSRVRHRPKNGIFLCNSCIHCPYRFFVIQQHSRITGVLKGVLLQIELEDFICLGVLQEICQIALARLLFRRKPLERSFQTVVATSLYKACGRSHLSHRIPNRRDASKYLCHSP